MKKWFTFLCLLLLSSFASYGQNVYQHFSELNGMEDYNINTNLLYRINSVFQDTYNYNTSNNIYLLNVVNKQDSLFQYDGSYDNEFTGHGWRSVNSYDFWQKNPRLYILCGSGGGSDGSPFIERFDNKYVRPTFFGSGGFIGISHQNDSLVYTTFNDGILYRSLNGGLLWDTASSFNPISLSPFNDKVLYSSEHNKIIKTIDGGLTKIVVDSIPLDVYRTVSFFYDKDTSYNYCTEYYYNVDHYIFNFIVSNASGNVGSWQKKFTSALPMHLSVDNSVSGSIYLATGRYIYHSTDFGNTFSLFHSFERSLVGIYKKPGSSKLYAATFNTIYEIDGSTINILKQIPIDKEIFKFDPLDMGNKWVYKSKLIVAEGESNFIRSKEVIKDTLLANQQVFKQIKYALRDSVSTKESYIYERIDSLNGKVYFWNNTNGTEYLVDDLNMNLSDTINASRFNIIPANTSLDSLNTIKIFGISKETHKYNSQTSPLGYGDKYSLTKDFGITYHLSGGDQVWSIDDLKGAVIKGIVYGDTSTVTGITDKYPNLPDKYALSQNYPNPFNPTTTINYSIPKAGIVKLTVYNAIGSRVATILNEYKPAGNYSVQFNASNLASGIYLYRLESGNFTSAKKFILLK
jgi:hypothetical protein